jgi:hypothetical protein
MFDRRKSIATRLTDTADLLIDFATLGEYGLEPVGRTARACEADRRAPVTRARKRGVRDASMTFRASGAA